METIWTEASYLILPAIMIEDANLVAGVKRATQIVRDNLLLIGVSTVGVRWITGLMGFLTGIVGLVIGGAVGYGIISASGSSTTGTIIGITAGALIFFGLVVDIFNFSFVSGNFFQKRIFFHFLIDCFDKFQPG